MERCLPEVRNSFTNNKGETFSNIREIAFFKNRNYGGFGDFICESHKMSMSFDDDYIDGIYLYRSRIDSNKAYRIDKQYLEPTFTGTGEEKFISKLQEKQSSIKLSEFPTGVVTMDGIVVGQEVPYYNGPTLKEYAENCSKLMLPTKIYIQLLDIIKEQFANGVYYSDIHANNYVLVNGIVKPIDFQDHLLSIDEVYSGTKKNILFYLAFMIHKLNQSFQIPEDLIKLTAFHDLDDGYEKVLKLEENLINRGYSK